MLKHIFAKVSVFFDNAFEFGVYSEQGVKPAVWAIPGLQKNIPYLKAQNAGGMNIFIRPVTEVSDKFMLVDDLNSQQVKKHKGKPGRMIIESSPDNFQVWIYSQLPLTLDEKIYWLERLGSDPGAAPNKRWGRCPGFTNRKQKYQTVAGFPFAKLIEVDFRPVLIPSLPITSQPVNFEIQKHRDHGKNLEISTDHISRDDYETGDASVTDFRFIMALVKRGFSDEEIRDRLLHERENWQHHQGGHRLESYLARTIRKARIWTK